MKLKSAFQFIIIFIICINNPSNLQNFDNHQGWNFNINNRVQLRNTFSNQTLERSGINPVSKYYAIIIGISDYPGTSNDLKYCHLDAINIQNLLISNFFFPANSIQLLINSSAMKYNITSAINSLKNVTTSNDVIFFFFSGHGYRDSNDAYLVPFDGLLGPKIAGKELSGWLNTLNFKQMYVIIDACYSGSILVDLSNPKIFCMTACSGDQLCYESDSLNDGVFTHYFLDSFSRNYNGKYLYDVNNDSCIDLYNESFPHINESSCQYYRSLNYTVTPQVSNWSVPISLDWQLQLEHSHCGGDYRYLELDFENNRTQDFNLSINYWTVPSLANLATNFNCISSAQVSIVNETAPLLLHLDFLNGSTNYCITIRQTIQYFAVNYSTTILQVPDAPTLTSIQPRTSVNGTLFLIWIGSSGATSYKIYRSMHWITTINNSVMLVGTFPSTNGQDSGLTSGVYFYVVTAVNGSGESGISNCIGGIVEIPLQSYQLIILIVCTIGFAAVIFAVIYRKHGGAIKKLIASRKARAR